MTPELLLQIQVLTPEIFLFAASLILLLVGVYGGNRTTGGVNLAAIMVLVAAVYLLLYNLRTPLPPESPFIVDAFAMFGKTFILLGTLFSLVIGTDWLSAEENQRFEYPILVLLSTLGMMIMVSAHDLLMVYLGLELSSLALYVLAAFNRDQVRSTEAGLKYFVLGSLGSGMLLFGISLVYGYAGSINFSQIAAVLAPLELPVPGATTVNTVPYGLSLGLILMLVGLCFKIAAAPFHMWSPDVYEGAPTPVTAFFAVAPKIAAIMLLIRLLAMPFIGLFEYWQQIAVAVAALSMIVGALGALRQHNIKRLLAYSSIGHVGYLLMGLSAGTTDGYASILIYLALYLFMSIGAFGCVLMMRRRGVYIEEMGDLAGISRHHPRFAFALAVFMFSMAGIPPLAGFFAKMYVFLAAVQAGLIWLAVLGVLSSVVAAYYYIRIVKLMYFDEEGEGFELPESPSLSFTVGFCTFVMLAFILRPSLLVEPAMNAARALMP